MAKKATPSSDKTEQKSAKGSQAADKKVADKKAGGKKTARKKTSKRKAAKTPRKTAAQAVRDFMETHPHLRNRDIVKALGEVGIVIDDTIPAQIKSRDKKKKTSNHESQQSIASETKPKKSQKSTPAAGKPARSAAIKQPTIFVHSPVHEEFARDLLSVRTHSQAIKNMRIHVAKLERIIEIMEVLKDDDWELTLLAQPDGLFFSAIHDQAHDVAQIRARLEKLSILPNEVVIVDAVS